MNSEFSNVSGLSDTDLWFIKNSATLTRKIEKDSEKKKKFDIF